MYYRQQELVIILVSNKVSVIGDFFNPRTNEESYNCLLSTFFWLCWTKQTKKSCIFVFSYGGEKYFGCIVFNFLQTSQSIDILLAPNTLMESSTLLWFSQLFSTVDSDCQNLSLAVFASKSTSPDSLADSAGIMFLWSLVKLTPQLQLYIPKAFNITGWLFYITNSTLVFTRLPYVSSKQFHWISVTLFNARIHMLFDLDQWKGFCEDNNYHLDKILVITKQLQFV